MSHIQTNYFHSNISESLVQVLRAVDRTGQAKVEEKWAKIHYWQHSMNKSISSLSPGYQVWVQICWRSDITLLYRIRLIVKTFFICVLNRKSKKIQSFTSSNQIISIRTNSMHTACWMLNSYSSKQDINFRLAMPNASTDLVHRSTIFRNDSLVQIEENGDQQMVISRCVRIVLSLTDLSSSDKFWEPIQCLI